MNEHRIGTQEEWQAERDELLEREKEHMRSGDELARQRRELPWVPVEKEYRFETEEGARTLAELFDGRSQLLIYHIMYGPDYTVGACPICSSMVDGFNALLPYLHARDVTMLLVSRAPVEVLQAYKRRMGWSIPWASTAGNDFNSDFGVSYPREQVRELLGPVLDDPPPGLRRLATATGTDVLGYVAEAPAPTSTAFVLYDGTVYYAYSTQGRGVEFLMGYYPILDRAPKGRDEGDVPAPDSMFWIQRHDEYGDGDSGPTN